MTVAPAAPHTAAVIAAISGRGLLTGRGKMPEGAGWQGEPGTNDHVPYAVVFALPGSTSQASLAETHTYLDYSCQVTVVSATEEGVEVAMDIVRAALVDQRLTVDGRASWRVQPLMERPADSDPSATPPLHYAVAQFQVRTEPA